MCLLYHVYSRFIKLSYAKRRATMKASGVLVNRESGKMAESSEQWYNRQAVEQLALHIPFERDTATKSEQIEMLRGLVLRHGRTMDPHMFGFEARTELIRLGLWSRIGPQYEE